MDDLTRLLFFPAAIIGAIITAVVPRWAEVRDRRRTSYADAVQRLVAWAEYPYRIARRVDDKPETLKEIATLGHTLQEQLAFHRAWIYAESSRMGQLYSGVVGSLKGLLGPAIQEAWRLPPVSSPSSMNIGDLGINQSQVELLTECIVQASNTRFGWSRLFGFLHDRKKVYTVPIISQSSKSSIGNS